MKDILTRIVTINAERGFIHVKPVEGEHCGRIIMLHVLDMNGSRRGADLVLKQLQEMGDTRHIRLWCQVKDFDAGRCRAMHWWVSKNSQRRILMHFSPPPKREATAARPEGMKEDSYYCLEREVTVQGTDERGVEFTVIQEHVKFVGPIADCRTHVEESGTAMVIRQVTTHEEVAPAKETAEAQYSAESPAMSTEADLTTA